MFLNDIYRSEHFSEGFQLTLLRSISGITIYGSQSLMKDISWIIRLMNQKLPLDSQTEKWMLYKQAWKQHRSPCMSPLELLGNQMHCQWAVIFWKECLFLRHISQQELKIFRKPYCKQMCTHPGYVAAFIECSQNRLNITLRGLIFSE